MSGNENNTTLGQSFLKAVTDSKTAVYAAMGLGSGVILGVIAGFATGGIGDTSYMMQCFALGGTAGTLLCGAEGYRNARAEQKAEKISPRP